MIRVQPVLRAPLRVLATLAMTLAWAGAAFALPSGPSVAGISGGGSNPTFNTSGSSLTVTQTSTRAVIDWNTFNIANGESVTFNQPSSSAIAFNVVPASAGVTTIAGQLTANGGVWLFSPSGIVFGAGALVNTGSFLASTGLFNSTSLNEALNDNSIQIFPQTSLSTATIEVDAASGSLAAASITATNGFVLLQSPTIVQAGNVTASDAVVYNTDEDIGNGVTISPGASGVTLVDEQSFSGGQGASNFTQTGTTTAGTWFEVDAAEDVTSVPGDGIINLGGHVAASGMKATGNPDDKTNGFSVILDGDSAGDTTHSEVTTVDGSAGVIDAADGIFAQGGEVKTGQWTSSGGAVTISGGGAGVEVDQPLVSTGTGLVSIGAVSVAVDANLTAAGSVLIGSEEGIQVGANVTIQAGDSIGGSSLTLVSAGSVAADPTSTLLVGPSLSAPNGALSVSAGGNIDVTTGFNLHQTLVGQGGDVTLGTAAAGTITLQATAVNDVGGTINIPGDISAPGEISLDATGPADVDGSITSAGSIYIAADALNLGPTGGIAAGFSGSGPAPAGTLSTGSGSANLTLQDSTSADLVPVAQAPAAGDIALGAPITWSNPGDLTLDAFHSIIVSGSITDTGTAQVVLKTDDGGAGGDYSFIDGGSLSFTNTPGGGQGLTINGQAYTLIYSEADLLNINNDLGGFYALAAPLDLAPLNSAETGGTATIFSAAPIASLVSDPFTGTFTGLGNTISNLNIVAATPIVQVEAAGYATTGQVGLFGTVGPTGVVRDVNLVNATVSGVDGMQVGALVGGLAGTVKDSSSSGEVSVGSGLTTAQGYADATAGGLVGGSDGTIVNSSSSAFVSAGDGFAGGLVGVVSQGGSVAGSSASGDVSVGSYSGNTADPVPMAGGLVGLIYGYQFGGVNPIQVEVSGSFATGDVTGGSGTDVGGFVGLVEQGQVTTSYATGSVTQTAPPVIFSASNFPSNLIGGFAGVVFTGGSVTQSWASGAVTTIGPAAAASTTTPGSFAGGFVGDMDGGATISDSYSLGPVTATGGAGNIDGGFAGLIQGAATADAVYATGLVSSTGVAAGLVGLLGNSADTASPTGFISNSYWDEGTTGQSVGYNQNGSGTPTQVTGISGAAAYDPATYANFDLANTWFMVPGDTRPILRSEYSTTITDAHQLQLMALNPGAAYTLANNIDASETSSASGVWNSASGFVPVGGNNGVSFTGTLNGAGHTIS
ncbi:MAG TPA: filamentous hemagglutinin N-terminal domain-containing protein, partial [Caulobacteraceae bacterium]|nr:filamentous hemagglutinin N-terminal domain-containing protein [Caulobacteraceae bacterium]